jgi:hypothetical protein
MADMKNPGFVDFFRCYRDLTVRSADRTSGTSTSFIVPVSPPLKDFTVCRFVDAIIPNSVYNITASNNGVSFERASTEYTFNVDPGYYNATELAAALQTGIETANADGTVVTYTEATFKFTFTRGNNFKFLFETGTNASTSIYKEIGYTAVDTADATSHTSINAVSLEGPLRYYLDVDELLSKNKFVTSGAQHSFRLNTGDSRGIVSQDEVTSYASEEQGLMVGCETINRLTCRLYDGDNNLVDLNGSEMEFTLKFY